MFSRCLTTMHVMELASFFYVSLKHWHLDGFLVGTVNKIM